MSDEGSVSRDHVIAVLKAAVNSMTVDGVCVTLVQDGIPEVYILPNPVSRKLLHRFHRKYGVKIEWFYHPSMFADGPGTPQ